MNQSLRHATRGGGTKNTKTDFMPSSSRQKRTILSSSFWLRTLITSALTAATFCGSNSNFVFAQETSADEEIKKKLNELLSQPKTSLTGIKTFEQQDDHQPPALRPLAATVGREIDCTVSRATSFSGQFLALSVRVENKSDKTLVIDGDRATLSIAGDQKASIPCLAQANIDAIGRPPTTARAKIRTDFKSTIAAALTVGAIPTAQTIITEHGPILKRYEWDEQRRTHEESRFGRRLLYPGDKSDGLIFFAGSVSFDQKSLLIPVKSFYDGTEQASLVQSIPPSVFMPEADRK